MIKSNFIKIYEDSLKANWELPALSDYGDNNHYTYAEIALEIKKLHILFEKCQIKKGEKIALTGRNNCRWCISYLATVTYGAIIVPILQDFNPNDVHHIINHSESSLLFCSDHIWENLDEKKIIGIRGVFSLNDSRLLFQRDKESFGTTFSNLENYFKSKYPDGFTKNHVQFAHVPNENVVVLNYTSGTTGFSKGVMITGNNLSGNLTFAHRKIRLKKGNQMLSFLPLAHAYGCAFEFLYSLSEGCHVTLLGKTPSPKILMKAFEEMKPALIIAVPLIFEKIYKNTILPIISKKSIRLLLNVPLLKTQIYSRIRKKLFETMGGRFTQVIIGGAPLSREIEDFFHKIKFPISIGYGMTECAPLISFSPYPKYIPHSCGKVLDNMEVRIDSPDPHVIAGEIQVRGENVMLGYYKYEEATRDVFTEDNWLKTGDLGTIDRNNNIFIRGRSKSMILGASGQNIYPEEIEAKLNNLPFIMESLIVEKDGKLIALVYPDYEAIDRSGISTENLPTLMEENKTTLNNMVAGYEKISEVQLYPVEFEKTPKKSIKRYLYNHI